MLLKIYETDPEAFTRGRFADDCVGRFRSGTMNGKFPVTLSEWRVTTGDPEVATSVAGLFGGEPREWQSSGEDKIEVMTRTTDVAVILDGPDAISACMTQWGNRSIIHQCDGVTFISGDDTGRPCGCPQELKERKARAKAERGPKPDIRILFRLANEPDLGLFRFNTASWDMTESLPDVHAALVASGGLSSAVLTLELVEYTTKKGVDVSYYKPVLKGIKALDEAGFWKSTTGDPGTKARPEPGETFDAPAPDEPPF